MAWIESHDDIWEHHKTLKLMRVLNISDVAAVGHLHSLWHFVLRNAWRDANLEPWGIEGVEAAARWRGDCGVFFAAMQEIGYLDDFEAHGWSERAGKLVQDRIYNEERRKNVTLRRKADATVPYRTQPNPTVPNLTITDTAPRLVFCPPTLDQVEAYCKERGKGVDPQAWMNHYTSNGWKVGKNSMKNWQAAVRTWEKNSYGTNQGGSGASTVRTQPTEGKYANLERKA